MRRNLITKISAAIFIVVLAAMFNLMEAKAACPTVPPGIDWQTKEITNTYVTAQGCTVNVTITWCYAVIERLHYVSFSDIKICVTGCDPKKINPEDYYTTETVDKSLIDFSSDSSIVNGFLYPEPGIQPCPNYLCYLQVYDAKCYKGWELDEQGCWKMMGCDNKMRRCASTILICFNAETGKTEVRRIGIETPDPCPDPSCKVKCF